jgi:hypothetical protein
MKGLLFGAAVNEDLATIKRLRAEGVDVTAKRDKFTQEGFTAIMHMLAAMNGHATALKFLQEAGAKLEP